MLRRLALIPAVFLLAARHAAAQADHVHAAPATGSVGRVTFATSCSAAAQPVFERGVALLHSFWYEEAAATFRAAATADSSCAMAYWGLASSYLHPLWAAPSAAELQAGTGAMARARLFAPASARERGYIEAIGAYYDSAATKPHGVRLRAWEQALGRLHQGNAADTEAAIFHALSLIATQSKTDTTYAQLLQAAAILEPLFAREPNHPGISHYLIHALDAPPLVGRAVGAAERYATIAPSVPHAQHMPSHSYSLLGMWDESVAANLRSAEAARRFEVEQHMDGVWDQRLHAMDYLAYAWLQQGRDSLARALVVEGAAVQRTIPPSSPAADYALAAIPARFALERGDWRAAVALTPRTTGMPHTRAVTHFARALGAARLGDTATARTELARLDELEGAARQTPDPFAPGMVHINRLAAAAWLELASGDTAGAIRTATEAAETEERTLKNPLTPGPLLSARELLGDMLLQVGRSGDAVEAYRLALVSNPGRARSLQGGIRAAELAGNAAAVRQWSRELAGVRR